MFITVKVIINNWRKIKLNLMEIVSPLLQWVAVERNKGKPKGKQTPNSIQFSTMYKTDSCSAAQEIHRVLCKPHSSSPFTQQPTTCFSSERNQANITKCVAVQRNFLLLYQ